MKLKKGDEVIVTSGKDKGRRGKIETVDTKNETALVAGANLYKRHLKKRDEKRQGGIIDFPRPLPVGNVALICPKCKKQTRIGYVVVNKEKQRICRKCGQPV